MPHYAYVPVPVLVPPPSLDLSGRPGVRSRNAASWIAFLLGGSGAHRFYLRQYWQGALYLLFCWTLVPSLIGVVDSIRYGVMSELKFHQRYNAGRLTPAELEILAHQSAYLRASLTQGLQQMDMDAAVRRGLRRGLFGLFLR
jgi:TM2 domain-containing membrane protein YozV